MKKKSCRLSIINFDSKCWSTLSFLSRIFSSPSSSLISPLHSSPLLSFYFFSLLPFYILLRFSLVFPFKNNFEKDEENFQRNVIVIKRIFFGKNYSLSLTLSLSLSLLFSLSLSLSLNGCFSSPVLLKDAIIQTKQFFTFFLLLIFFLIFPSIQDARTIRTSFPFFHPSKIPPTPKFIAVNKPVLISSSVEYSGNSIEKKQV